MANKVWNTDKIIGISAMLISVMTLVVLIYQTSLMREQQRLSVLPYLSMGRAGTGTAEFQVFLTNNGIGPAFIESMRIHYDGKVYESDLATFLYKDIEAMDSISHIMHSNIYPGMLLSAGTHIPILQADNSKESGIKLYFLLEKLDKKGFNYELIYKNIYNERWRLTTADYIPQKLD